jgi:hypothetical protein
MFEAEYIQLVIKPKVDLILEDGVESIADLTAKFNAAFDCKVSKAKATGWLKALGYRVTRTVQIMRPRASAPAPAPERTREVEEFRTGHRQLQFNFGPPPPSFFGNVVPPGFEE